MYPVKKFTSAVNRANVSMLSGDTCMRFPLYVVRIMRAISTNRSMYVRVSSDCDFKSNMVVCWCWVDIWELHIRVLLDVGQWLRRVCGKVVRLDE